MLPINSIVEEVEKLSPIDNSDKNQFIHLLQLIKEETAAIGLNISGDR
ncbi:hypothetical protein [Brevibacillus daliensis]|nr:hypothetical protein [Brevibacillus daliensis]